MPAFTINSRAQAIQQRPSNLTLVLDQGSHASRAALFSAEGSLLQLETVNVSTHNPEKAHFEQDAHEILDSLQTLLTQIDRSYARNIKFCGLCTQRSTVVAWHKQTGQALSPAISWRDLRASKLMQQLKPEFPDIERITGLPFSAHYSASKINWLLNNNAGVKQAAKEHQLCIAPLSSFLLFHLLKERPFVIDHSNAQRSLLFDIEKRCWSEELLQLFEISRLYLPECKPIVHLYGHLKELNIPLTAACGDQNAVLHAYPQTPDNNTLVNIGTGAFILSNALEQRAHAEKARLLRSIVNSRNDRVRLVTEGTVNGAGAALTHILESAPCENLFEQLPRWLNDITSPPIFINTVSGLGSPWWCDAGPAEFISGDTHSLEEGYVAIIESIVFLIDANLQRLQRFSQGSSPEVLFLSGGLSRLDALCQKLADLCGLNILRFEDAEASARGCAWLARQLQGSNNQQWKVLEASHKFRPSENPLLMRRYQQFIAELYRRCDRS
ncbi:Glycerol kinase [hydrothermal vent metagenome]|uniref:Glycerol kinase n=1 Tax=hydrothermal vent metagenome TaxID=652676 RepID=A0A3B0XHA6_9ZZZZ